MGGCGGEGLGVGVFIVGLFGIGCGVIVGDGLGKGWGL